MKELLATAVSFDDFLKEQLKDPRFKKEYDRISTRYETGITILEAREDAGLTRPDLARKAHAIKHIENGGNTIIDVLAKIANVLGKRLDIKFTERT